MTARDLPSSFPAGKKLAEGNVPGAGDHAVGDLS